MKEESLLLLSDLQKLINQVVLIDYTIIILGGFYMKVSIELSPEYSEPYAIIYADKITDSIQRTLDIFGSNESPITALQNENDIVILQPKEIYMVRVENKDTIIYGKEHRYRSRKRLYEMQQQLGAGFMQIAVLGNYTTLQHSLYLLIAHHAPGGGKQNRCQYHGKRQQSPDLRCGRESVHAGVPSTSNSA